MRFNADGTYQLIQKNSGTSAKTGVIPSGKAVPNTGVNAGDKQQKVSTGKVLQEYSAYVKNMYRQHLQKDGSVEHIDSSIDSWLQYWISYSHFEERDAKNVNLPSSNGITNREQLAKRLAKGDWVLMTGSMNLFHDNGIGAPEMKFVHPDGREVVFDGDTGEIITDPRYKGTYNYVSPVRIPKENESDMEKFLLDTKAKIGHVWYDVIPYFLVGGKNERTQ